MANKRITKEMAKQAAEDMKEAVYRNKLNTAWAVVESTLDTFAKNYFPAPVLACVSEYKDFLRVSKCLELDIYDGKNERGFIGGYKRIIGNTTIELPVQQSDYLGSLCILKVTKQECKAVIEAEEVWRKILDDSITFCSRIETALLSLKTEKKIREQLPEALPYLKFPDDKSNLPAPIFSELRTMLQGIAEKKQ